MTNLLEVLTNAISGKSKGPIASSLESTPEHAHCSGNPDGMSTTIMIMMQWVFTFIYLCKVMKVQIRSMMLTVKAVMVMVFLSGILPFPVNVRNSWNCFIASC